MNCLIRTDASVQIGHGHVMRCLTLAQRLRKEGVTVAFICRDCQGNLIDYIEDKGFVVYKLFSDSGRYLSPSSSSPTNEKLSSDGQIDDCMDDAECAKSIAKMIATNSGTIDWLIVDHYGLDIRWEKKLRPFVGNILVIDDFDEREHDCNILLDQNYSSVSDRYVNKLPKNCLRLLGPRYALLREDFSHIRLQSQVRKGGVQHLLVYFGGSDLQLGTLKTIQSLSRMQLVGIEIDVILGQSNPHKKEIVEMARDIRGMRCHFHVENLHEMMAHADLAIGACGTTTWERCCLGLPTLVATIAPNQETISEDLAAGGYILLMGKCDHLTENDIETNIQFALSNPYLLTHISANCMALVDGEGARRVINYMMSPQIKLRSATYEDRHQLFSWRNATENRKYSHSSDPIAWEIHKKWLNSVLADDNKQLLIGELDGTSVGVLRYEIEENSATVSIYMVPGNHSRGLGAWLLKEGTRLIKEKFADLKTIVAEIQCDNIKSQHVFKKAGFEKRRSVYVKSVN